VAPEIAHRKFQLLDLLKFNRSVWAFLLIGIAVRCIAMNHPLVDAHLIRQCQTAAATKSLIVEPGFHLSSKIPWLGDLDAHYVLELPIYNYLVIGAHSLTGNLDLSGKLTTILLWAASFICLQFIWRRILDSPQTFWANLLFVVAPLDVFFGQAFMPEMLIQLLAFGFIWQLLRYEENPNLVRWVPIVGIGLLGLLVKLPETAHLYLILGFLVFRREGWKAVIRPRYLLAAIITIVAIKGWSTYVDSVNAAYLPEWNSAENLRGFIGSLGSRLQLKPWIMIFLYVGILIVPGPAALATAYGFLEYVRKHREKILGLWFLSLVFFYLLWFGNGATGQSYYNLPVLAPLCALFGIGMHELLAKKWILRWPRIAATSAVVLVVLPAIPIWRYLFQEDRQIFEAALWTKRNTQPSEITLFQLNHRPDMIDYPYNPVPAYYSERPTFIWTTTIPEVQGRMVLERAHYAVVSLPQPPATDSLALINRFRAVSSPQMESTDWLAQAGFQPLMKQTGFEVFRKN
jgi:Dolichyl-phosphate-mannose-protein mannosyltransferase